MVAVVWNFETVPDQGEAFERFYGADGEWTQLSRKSRSFLGSSFLRDLGMPTRYLLVEYWSEMLVYEKHTADFDAQIKVLEGLDLRLEVGAVLLVDQHLAPVLNQQVAVGHGQVPQERTAEEGPAPPREPGPLAVGAVEALELLGRVFVNRELPDDCNHRHPLRGKRQYSRSEPARQACLSRPWRRLFSQ